ncbi:MAG: type I methionyl aminopeptidase [Parcubacteria group bacterium]
MIRLKTEEEIEILKEGGRRHAEILESLASMVKPGLSALELEEKALELIEERGDKPAFLGYKPDGAKRVFPAALCVSINEEIVHGIPNEKKKILKEGDIVTLDLGIIHKGLITDSAVTVPVGKVSVEAERLIETTKQALARGIESAQPGNTTGDIGLAISEVVASSGFTLARDLAGHGVGFGVHEDPFVPNFGRSGEGDELVEGLVIAIEPMVNIGKSAIKVMDDGYTIKTGDNSLSAHFEHTVAITKKGNIILTL